MFMVRTLCLPATSIYRQLMVSGMNAYQRMEERGEATVSPIGDIMKYVNRYGLHNVIQKCLNDGRWVLVSSCKNVVKKKILCYDDTSWKASCVLYRKLSTYVEIVPKRAINIWWTVVSHVSGHFNRVWSVMALVCGTQPKGYGTNFGLNARCQICTSFNSETFEHTVFNCDRLNNTRERLIDNLREVMPQNMWTDFIRMPGSQKLKFLLSGLMCDEYMPEWKDIYLRTSDLIFELYRERALVYKQLNEL